jgi:light-regulated signal transduction histidine kinase (bacteriophytochrome)
MTGEPVRRTIVASEAELAACADEPIHIPGAIQPHGALVAADEQSLRITHVSANLARATGVSGRSQLGRPLSDLLGAEAVTAILEALATERYSAGNVLSLDLPFPRDPRRNVMAHRHCGRIVVEIEHASAEADYEMALAPKPSCAACAARARSASCATGRPGRSGR